MLILTPSIFNLFINNIHIKLISIQIYLHSSINAGVFLSQNDHQNNYTVKKVKAVKIYESLSDF